MSYGEQVFLFLFLSGLAVAGFFLAAAIISSEGSKK